MTRSDCLVVSPAVADRLSSAFACAPFSPSSANNSHSRQAVKLKVAVLARPVSRGEKGNERDISCVGERDIHCEVAATVDTLRQLALVSGALVVVMGVGSSGTAHLARLLVIDEMQGGRPGCLHIAPMLAFNLGLRPCITPLLSPGHTPAGAGLEGVEVSAAVGGPSGDAPSAHIQMSQPIGRALHIPLASRVTAAQVRRVARSSTDDSGTSDLGTRFVAALQSYFRAATRMVAPGDVFAVAVDTGDGRREILSALYPCAMSTIAHLSPSQVHGDIFFFKVVSMEPECCAAVDPETTALTLGGSCASALPVGVLGYCEREEVRAGSGGGLTIPMPVSLDSMALGVDAHAAWADMPTLRHVGPMLPLWKEVGRTLAPLALPSSHSLALRAALLLVGPPGSGRRSVAEATAAALGFHLATASCLELRGGSDSATAAALKAAFDSAAECAPAVLLLTHLPALTASASPSQQAPAGSALRLANVLAEEITRGCSRAGSPVQSGEGDSVGAASGPLLLIACAESAEDVAAPLRRCFTHEIVVEPPSREQREALLRHLLGRATMPSLGAEGSRALVGRVAQQAVGLLPRELVALCADAGAQAVRRRCGGAGQGAGSAVPALREEDVDGALETLRRRTATDVGAPTLATGTKWDDVGGLEHCKRAILDTVQMPMQHRALFSGGLRQRSGVLLYGPPGTGKTLLAKAVASECAVNFLSVKGPELINMYIGESERQIREVFARARRAAPCVIFFDEMDALAPARGAGADSGGVMDRVVSQLLAEVDGVQGSGDESVDVFIIAATNRPDLLDPALLRPGRLDTLLYVGVAADPPARCKVLQALTRNFELADAVDLMEVAQACPPRFTGADMYALCSDAWTAAMKRRVRAGSGGAVGREELKDKGGGVVVMLDDFRHALANLQPSLSEGELARYEALRLQYEAR